MVSCFEPACSHLFHTHPSGIHLDKINVPLLPFAEQILRMPEPAAAIAWGICLGMLAVVVYRVNAKLPIKEDHWREG